MARLDQRSSPLTATARALGMAAWIVAVCAIAAPIAASAQSAAEQELRRLEQERSQREAKEKALTANAERAVREVAALRQRLVAAAAARDKLEREVESSETRLVELRARERAAAAKLGRDREALEQVIVALIAVERDRPPALAVRPDDAAQAARAAILMGEVAPRLRDRARGITEEIARLRGLREAILMQDRRFSEATRQLQRARQSIGGLIAERRQLEARLRRDAASERRRIDEIARRSSDLRELVARLGQSLPDSGPEAADEGPAFAQGFARARGSVAAPVAGALTRTYGARLPEGGRSTGIVIRTRRAAQVTSPWDGRVEFAGPFRTWGRVLIINVGDGHHIVLAGLGATFAEAGQEVLAGEPLGEMSPDPRLVPDLYMEIREGEQPRDPALWLRRLNGA